MNLQVEKVGADPEVICTDNDGNVKSIIGYLGGSKEEPLPVKMGAVQEDNVLAEFNIEPAQNPNQFNMNISTVMEEMRNRLPNFQLSRFASAQFEMEDLLSGGEKSMSFGCDPDLDVYSMMPNENIGEEAPWDLRTAGGHVHVGLNEVANDLVIPSVKMMDLFLGVPSVLLDQDRERKKLYGKAGAFRFKDYGFEYRTLSNFWIFEEVMRKWVYENTCKAIEKVQEIGEIFSSIGGEEVVRTTINEGNIDVAKNIIDDLAISMPRMD